MVVPDRIVQAERLVALPPAVAGPLVLLDNDGRNAELPEARAECYSALTSADDDDVGLACITEFGRFGFALFLPCLAARVMAVLGAEPTSELPLAPRVL